MTREVFFTDPLPPPIQRTHTTIAWRRSTSAAEVRATREDFACVPDLHSTFACTIRTHLDLEQVDDSSSPIWPTLGTEARGPGYQTSDAHDWDEQNRQLMIA